MKFVETVNTVLVLYLLGILGKIRGYLGLVGLCFSFLMSKKVLVFYLEMSYYEYF